MTRAPVRPPVPPPPSPPTPPSPPVFPEPDETAPGARAILNAEELDYLQRVGEVARMRQQLVELEKALAKAKPRTASFTVDHGRIACHNVANFPIILSVEQWETILRSKLAEFIAINRKRLEPK